VGIPSSGTSASVNISTISSVASSCAPPDRRCAYATRLCVTLECSTVAEQEVRLGAA
jgi:hypothetical protein